MRAVLFRGKRVDNGKWVYGFYVRIGKSHFIFTGKLKFVGLNIDFECYEVIPETVGEYIGLKDNNGEEIFEGDIVRVKITQTEDIKIYGYCKYKVGFIVYSEDFALFTCKNNFMNFINWAFNDYEVIGNIYDNPELLEDKDNEQSSND